MGWVGCGGGCSFPHLHGEYAQRSNDVKSRLRQMSFFLVAGLVAINDEANYLYSTRANLTFYL